MLASRDPILPPRPHSPSLASDRDVARRLELYVERPGTIRVLDALAHGALASPVPNMLLVSGASGSGKTSLLAYWSALRFGAASPGFLVEHFVGLSGYATDHAEIIRRTIVAISDRFQIGEELPVTRGALEEEFPRWLGFVQSETLVLILDGLDHLDPRSFSLTWLPEYVQPHVRLVVSTRDDDQAELLRTRGCAELHVEPLSHDDRLAIVRRHVMVRSATLTHRQVHRVASAPASANPLFLRSSLEEVRAPAPTARVDERIDYYLEATCLEDLYVRILARLESEFDIALVRDVLCLLGAARRGLSLDELAAITGCEPELRQLARRLEFHLIERSGLLSLLHHELRNAVRSRYRDTREDERNDHRRLASFFADVAAPRRAEELPWQLLRLEDRARLADVVADIDLFHELYHHDSGLELMGYLLELGDAFDVPGRLVAAFAARFERTDGPALAGLGIELGTFLQLVGHYAAAIDLLSLVLNGLNGVATVDADRGRALMQIGRALREMGDLAESERHLRAALAVLEAVPAPPCDELVRCRCALGEVLSARADRAEARRVYHEAVRLAEAEYGAEHTLTAEVLVDLGPIELGDGRVEAAEATLRRALEICERAHGPDHPLTTQVLNNLAHVASRQGRAADAIALLERAADANRRVLGPSSRDVGVNLSNLGLLRRHAGDLDGAARDYEQALQIFRSSSRGRDSTDIATTLFNVGLLEQERGRLEHADRVLTEAHALFTASLGESHPSSLIAGHHRMLVAHALGDHERAAQIGRHRLAVIESLHGAGSEPARLAALELDRIRTARQRPANNGRRGTGEGEE